MVRDGSATMILNYKLNEEVFESIYEKPISLYVCYGVNCVYVIMVYVVGIWYMVYM